MIPTAKKSQRKGRGGELELSQVLQEYGYDVKPGRSQSYGAEPDVVGLPGVHIECKRVERLNLAEAMHQAERDARPGELPAVFHRRNGEPWLVTMPLEKWIEIYREWEAGR